MGRSDAESPSAIGSMRRSILLPILATLAGCPGPAEVETGPDAALLFLVQEGPPNSVMEALYQGRVEVDQAGCFRLDLQPERHTVVWPFGFRLGREKAGLVVLDGDDEALRIGDLVRLGGGEVQALPDGLVAAAMRQAALVRCPGPFWIVGEVLDPVTRS